MNATPADPACNTLELLDEPTALRRHTRSVVRPDGLVLSESSLRITGMHCAACAGIVEAALRRVAGVESASVAAASGCAQVRWDPRQTRMARIVQAVQHAGYGAVPDIALQARQARRLQERQALWRLFVATFCAMQVMMLATPGYVSAPGELAPDMSRLLNWGAWVLTWPVLLFSCGPFFASAWRSLAQRRIGMDVPVSLGIAVTFVAGTGATFDPGGPFGSAVYFDSLTMFVSFLLAARWLELRARHRSAQALEDTLLAMPEFAERVGAGGQGERVPVEQLRPGDTVRVALGQSVPADGCLLAAPADVSEALLTGESRPLAKAAGAPLVAGSVNVGAPLLMRVERLGEDTRLAGILALMRSAMAQRPAIARAADRWAGPFLWVVLLLAALAAAAWGVAEPGRAVWVAVSVLIVTCPCALSLAAPAAMLAAAGRLARDGVLLQRLDALQALAGVTRVYLDKTGTATHDRLELARTLALDGDAAQACRWLEAARELAAWSQHPLARALAGTAVEAAAAAGADAPRWSGVHEEPGHGLQGRWHDGTIWRLGSAAWVAGVPADRADHAHLWFGPVGQARIGWWFDEVVRPDAAAALARLRHAGVEVVLLSGDGAARVQPVAQRLGIDHWLAGLSPQAKLAEVAAAQAQGRCVAMVGDGVNDAPVLARADVSFAMGEGAVIARSQADFVVLSGRLQALAHAHDLARRCMRVVRQNFAWAASYNLVSVPLALAGALPPWAAGLGMACSSLVVTGNALRLARAAAARRDGAPAAAPRAAEAT